MTQKTIKIEGMSCQHCVMRVKKAIDGLPGVSSSEVAIGSAAITFDENKLTPEAVRAAIETAGYKVTG
jgi:copper chaperone